jgi:hypothetical protein
MANRRLEEWAPSVAAVLRSVPEHLRGPLGRQVKRTEEAMRRRLPRRTGELQARSGATLRSGSDGLPSVVAQIPAEYAPVEFGGTARPRRGRYLAVPVAAEVQGLSPRSVGQLITIVLADGRRFLARRDGPTARVLFRLIESVRIPGQHGLARAFDEATEDLAGDVLDTLTTEALGG